VKIKFNTTGWERVRQVFQKETPKLDYAELRALMHQRSRSSLRPEDYHRILKEG